MRVVAGNGGNASNPEDGAGYSGTGGAGTIGVANCGSINVAGDMLVSSGSSGHSARAGGAYEAVVAMVRHTHADCCFWVGTLFNLDCPLSLRSILWLRTSDRRSPSS
jgi:hypothetical protein